MKNAAATPPPYAVLFDMDGVLVDTEPLWFATETELLEELGGSWTADDHALLVGSALQVSSAFIANRAGAPVRAEDVAAELVERMAKTLRERAVLHEGARRLLGELEAAAIPRALVSSSHQVLVDAVLDALAPLHFDVVISGDAVEHNKPHPEPYLRAATALGVDPRWTVALEDSPVGVEAAQRAGCWVVAIPSVAPIDPAPRRAVVTSLTEVTLDFLRSLFFTRG
ncbi:MAG: HAD family phosphatase [Acidothermus sp.]|nr:HAD family phosphatase [Acidothermus sp.]MCL6537995.1 HAD family phosphatase [Acidothermus sp.]